MASIDDILTDALQDPCSGNLTITLRSYGPIHSFLAWSYYPPKKKTRYKKVRGARIECGFTYELQNYACIEQQEPGDTLIHTFQLPDTLIGVCIYYVHTGDCDFTTRPATSPPIKYCFAPCSSANAAIKVSSDQGPNFLSDGGPTFIGQWNAIIYDPQGLLPPPPGGPIELPRGYWTIRANPMFRWAPGFPGNASWRIRFLFGGASIFENNETLMTIGPDDIPTHASTYARIFAAGNWTATLQTYMYNGNFGAQVVNNQGEVYISAEQTDS